MPPTPSTPTTPTPKATPPPSGPLVPVSPSTWIPMGSLDAICQANGLSKDDFLAGKGALIEDFELFLMQFSALPEMTHFSGVKDLKLMHIGLTELPPISHMSRLENLWLSENDLTTLEGLNPPPSLRRLYCNSNSITSTAGIKDFSCASTLEALWLQENEITKIDGLSTLSSLSTLWLSKNNISTIGSSLHGLDKLTELNLAGNRLSSFREILPLALLPKLSKLYFADPTYGQNPICLMCNYTTFTIFNLRTVSLLDHVVISDDQRSVAESTFAKKKIYYNMRIKTLKRNARMLISRARQYRMAKQGELTLALQSLQRLKAELEAEVELFAETQPYSVLSCCGLDETSRETAAKKLGIALPADGPLSPEDESKINTVVAEGISESRLKLGKKKIQISAAIGKREQELATIGSLLNAALNRISRAANVSISRLLLELHTGGNVRLEDGKAADEWHKHCVGLVKNRFKPFASEFSQAHVTDLSISKVTQIHNRTLRGTFQSALERTVDITDASYRDAIEYLFVVENPQLSDEDFFKLVELGPTLGSGGQGIALTNSAAVVEQLRLRELAEPSTTVEGSPIAGRVIICKVFLGRTSAEHVPFAAVNEAVHGSAGAPAVEKKMYPGYTSVYRARPNDSKQRVWFMLDADLVLPEFVVEYTYTVDPAMSSAVKWQDAPRREDVAEVIDKMFPQASSIDTLDLRHLGVHFMAFAAACTTTVSSFNKGDLSALMAIAPVPPKRSLQADGDGAISSVGVLEEFLYGERVPTSPTVSAEALAELSANLPKALRMIPASKLDEVHAIAQNTLTSFANLPALMPALKVIVVPFCGIASLDCGTDFPLVERLDIRFNSVRTLAGLKRFPSLHTLHMSNNLLYRLDDAQLLVALGRGIVDLSVHGNPVCDSKGFTQFLVSQMPQLATLDGSAVAAMRSRLEMVPTKMSPQLLVAAVNAKKRQIAAAPHSSDVLLQRVQIYETALPLVATRQTVSETMNKYKALIARLQSGGPRVADAVSSAATPTTPRAGSAAASPVKGSSADEPSPARRTGSSLFGAALGQSGRPDSAATATRTSNARPGTGKEVDMLMNASPEELDVSAKLTPGTLCLLDLAAEIEARSTPLRTEASTPAGTPVKAGAGRIASKAVELDIADAAALECATAMTIRGLRLQQIENLDKAPSLVALDLGDNELYSMEGLQSNMRLESLCLESNCLWRIESLSGLLNLRRLELGRNNLSKLDGLESLTNLSFLSCEDNSISSLAPLEPLVNLIELYMANNNVPTIKDILPLRPLPRLIIVDFSANPCVKDESYRQYLVFQLKRVKVLDGVSIDQQEQQAARELFAGRVSTELLAERLPQNANWNTVVELSLASCGLRDITLLNELPALKHLAVDHNLLSDLSGLRDCPQLISLNASFNKLGQQVTGIGKMLLPLESLESLSLESNGLTSLQGMQLRLPRLKFLNLKTNDCLKLDGLSELPMLRELILDKNKIRAIERESFANNPHLKVFSCNDNALKMLDGLRAVPMLERCSLAANRISELGDVERHFEGLVNITHLTLTANQVSRKNMYRTTMVFLFPNAIQIDGKDVLLDERQRAEAFFAPPAEPQPPQMMAGPVSALPPGTVIDTRQMQMLHPPGAGVGGGVGIGGPTGVVGGKAPLRVMTFEPEGVVGQGVPTTGARRAPAPNAASKRTHSAEVSVRGRRGTGPPGVSGIGIGAVGAGVRGAPLQRPGLGRK